MAFFRNFFCTFVLLGLVTGCKFETQTQSGIQSFVIDAVSQSGAPRTQLVNETWPFLKYKTFAIRVCPRDAITLSPIQGEKFTLNLPSGEMELSDSVADCRAAQVSVTYNSLAAENQVSVNAQVMGRGMYQGVQAIPLAVNPWTDQVIDLRYAPGFATVSAENAHDAFLGLGRFRPEAAFQNPDNKSAWGNLFLESARLSFTHESSSTDQSLFRAHLTARPQFRRTNLEGSWHSEPISRGHFSLKLVITERNPTSGATETLAYAEMAEVWLSGSGVLDVTDLPVRFVRVQAPGTILVWSLSLEPLPPQDGLMAAIATGVTESLKLGSAFELALSESQATSFAAAKASLAPQLIKPPQDEKFRPSALGFRFKGAPQITAHPLGLSLDKKNLNAKLKADVNLCLVRSIGESPVAHQPIELTLTSQDDRLVVTGSLKATTDDEGCLSPADSFEIGFDPYDAVDFAEFTLTAQSAEAPFAGASNSARVFLNPWQRGERAFYWSNLRGNPPVNPQANRPAELLVAKISSSYSDESETFDLDRRMNLVRSSKMRLKIEPTVARPFVYGVENGPSESSEALEEGTRLKLRFIAAGRHHVTEIAQRPLPPEQLRYISGYESEVVVEKGAKNQNFISVDADFVHDFGEQILFKSSFSLFFELSSLNPKSSLKSKTFVAEFDPTERQEELNVFNSKYSLDELQAGMLPAGVTLAVLSEKPRVLKPRVVETLSPYEEFVQLVKPAAPENIVDISAEQVAWPGAFPATLRSKSHFDRFLNAERDKYLLPAMPDWDTDSVFRVFAKRLCGIYAVGLEKECETGNPLHFVEFQLLEFVDKVNAPPKKLSAPARTFDRNRLEFRVRFFKERIHTLRVFEGTNNSNNHEKGWTAHFGAERFGMGAGFARGVTYRNANYWASEVADTSDLRDRYEVMQAKLLNLYETRLTLNLNVKTCLWVRPASRNQAGADLPAFLICTEPRTRIFDESWYSIIGAMDFQGEGQVARDRQDPENRFVKLIRGSYLFREFYRVMGDRAKNLRLDNLGSPTYGPTHLLNEVYRSHQGPYSRYDKAGGLFPGISRYRVIPNPR